jgi:hypothetical protein
MLAWEVELAVRVIAYALEYSDSVIIPAIEDRPAEEKMLWPEIGRKPQSTMLCTGN